MKKVSKEDFQIVGSVVLIVLFVITIFAYPFGVNELSNVEANSEANQITGTIKKITLEIVDDTIVINTSTELEVLTDGKQRTFRTRVSPAVLGELLSQAQRVDGGGHIAVLPHALFVELYLILSQEFFSNQ